MIPISTWWYSLRLRYVWALGNVLVSPLEPVRPENWLRHSIGWDLTMSLTPTGGQI